MNSIKNLRRQILNPALSADERAQLRCQLAKQLQETEDFVAACEAMGELWLGIGAQPDLEGLEQPSRAEVLLRTGSLTGWIGGLWQIPDSQESARNMIHQSIKIFTSLRDARKVSEAETEIGYCYVREDAVDDARVTFAKARALLHDQDGDLKAAAILRSVALEQLTDHLHEALNILMKSQPLFETSENDTLKGRFHNQFADVLRDLNVSEHRAEYIDRALSEYSAASFHFEQAGNVREQGEVEINLAKLLLKVNRLKEAHEHLDVAQSIFTPLAEEWDRSVPSDDPTRDGSSSSSPPGDEQARIVFDPAINGAEEPRDLQTPPFMGLAGFEHLAEKLSEEDIKEFLQCVDDLLKSKNDPTAFGRNIVRARDFLIAHGFGSPDWTT